MIALAALLLSLGVSDAVAAGLPGHPPRRVWAGPAVGATAAVALLVLLGVGLRETSIVAVATALVTWGWTGLRAGGDQDVARAWGGLGLLALSSALALLTPLTGHGGLVSTVLGHSGNAGLAALDAERAALGLAAVVALGSTANAVVRLVLILAGPEVVRSRSRLRGGRLIGPLERYLILGLAVAGAPTAAGLVVAAKSALRFPELSSTARRTASLEVAGEPLPDELTQVDALTEYVLIGSLTSWLLALAPVALLR